MSHVNELTQVMVVRGVDLNSVADVTGGVWGPVAFPVMIRGIFAVITNAIAAAGVVKADKRPTAGDDTGRGDGDLGVLTFSTAHTLGKVVYHLLTDPVKLSPGEELVFQCTDATGASDTCTLGILMYPSWETPANIASMIATA